MKEDVLQAGWSSGKSGTRHKTVRGHAITRKRSFNSKSKTVKFEILSRCASTALAST